MGKDASALYDLEHKMTETLRYDYKMEMGEDEVSRAWDFIQTEIGACGVRGNEDWKQSDWFSDRVGKGKETLTPLLSKFKYNRQKFISLL